MIYITVGSQKFPFDRLLVTVDELVQEGTIQEEVFAQRGTSNYIPKHYESEPFLDRDKFQEKMLQSDIVITHGGTGAIVGAIKAGKKVIAVPRLAKYGEHVDDHQIQIIEEFTKTNFISSCEDLNQLGIVINEARKKSFNLYISNTARYLKPLDDYISKL